MNISSLKENEFVKILKSFIKVLQPLYTSLRKPLPGEWLYFHKESGQTFQQYIFSNPKFSRGKRNKLYIQPIGDFSPIQQEIITLTAQFMGIFYNLPINSKEKITLSEIPSSARRIHPTWGDHQILSTYILHNILKPQIPKDAAAYIAFTTSDLWPGKEWNFVFGQASMNFPIGVWSIYRNGDPHHSREEFLLCLLRTMKTGAHETGHIFSLEHCVSYKCLMNGSNSRQEADRRPLVCCPECMAKICWATSADPIKRFENLHEFCDKNGLQKQANFYQKALLALTTTKIY